MWWLYAQVFGMSSVLTVKYFAPQAAGSGIEQIRSIMTGYNIPGYLAVNTMVGKVVGLVMVQASGLTVGKEGPFVHISCTLANLLMNLPMFKDIRQSSHLYKQVISGVLFAIEVTSSVYHTADYWRAFFVCVVGILIFRELSYFGTARTSHISLFPTTFDPQPFSMSELPLFVSLSAIMGFYGGAYVKFLIGIRVWRQGVVDRAKAWKAKRTANKSVAGGDDDDDNDVNLDEDSMGGSVADISDIRDRSTVCPSVQAAARRAWYVISDYSLRVGGALCQPIMFAVTVITITASINWFGPEYMQRSLYAGITDFLVSGQMMTTPDGVQVDARVQSKDWGPDLLGNLAWYFVTKSFLCAIALALAVPTGTLIPMFAIGLSFGRLFGEAVQSWDQVTYAPGGYAVVGASAFLAGATGAVSTAMVVFEITYQLNYMVPVLIAVIIGRSSGKVISPDLYEALQIFKHLPNIPPLAHQSSYELKMDEIMEREHIPLVPKIATGAELQAILDMPTHRHDAHGHHNVVSDEDLFAVVNNITNDRVYLGSIARHQIKAVLAVLGTQGANRECNVLDVCNLNNVAPSIPISTPLADLLYMFEITLCGTLFIVDHSRVVGWVELEVVKEKCEEGTF